jgi:hypothetical protein
MHKIAVIGVGTAGLTSLSHLLAYLPDDWKVYSIHNPNINVLGIGESSGIDIPRNLYKGTRFNIFDDSHEIDATIKRGMKYVNWRKEDIMMSIVPPSYGIHFNNIKLKDFCLGRFESIWKNKFNTIHGNVDSIESNENCVDIVIDGINYEFNYVIDCRGYPEDYSDYVMSDVIPVNACQVNLKPEPGSWNYTYSIAHEHGWMFGVPTSTHQGWGYLYNDQISSKDEAYKFFAKRNSVKEEDLTLRELKFKNYYAKTYIDRRIIKNGNRAMFLEPIEAVAGHFYDQVMRYFFDYLLGNIQANEMNQSLLNLAKDIESHIAYIYHGGSIYNTEFWRITKEKCTDHLNNDPRFIAHINQLKGMTKSDRSNYATFGMFGPSTWEDLDVQFGYNYI